MVFWECLLRCTALYFVRQVLRDFYCLFRSRNSPTTGILHSFRRAYRSLCPTREAKPRFGSALERSAHDCETRLWNRRKSLLVHCVHVIGACQSASVKHNQEEKNPHTFAHLVRTNVSAMFDNPKILLFWLSSKQTFHMFSLHDLRF